MTGANYPRQRSSSVVYFIRPIGMQGPVKIGVTSAPRCRLSGLNTWSPFPLEVAAEIAGDRMVERQFHGLFRHLHSHGEWFRWSPELQACIEQIGSGTFDVSALPSPVNLRTLPVRKPWTQAQKDAVRGKRVRAFMATFQPDAGKAAA